MHMRLGWAGISNNETLHVVLQAAIMQEQMAALWRSRCCTPWWAMRTSLTGAASGRAPPRWTFRGVTTESQNPPACWPLHSVLHVQLPMDSCSHPLYCCDAGATQQLDALAANPDAGWAAGALQLMVDSAWLAYEEPWVIQDVLRRMEAPAAITLTFVSITYEVAGA